MYHTQQVLRTLYGVITMQMRPLRLSYRLNIGISCTGRRSLPQPQDMTQRTSVFVRRRQASLTFPASPGKAVQFVRVEGWQGRVPTELPRIWIGEEATRHVAVRRLCLDQWNDVIVFDEVYQCLLADGISETAGYEEDTNTKLPK